MSHSKPYVRKKAVLAMYKLFVAYPQGLRLTFDKLKDKLNDGEEPLVHHTEHTTRSMRHLGTSRGALGAPPRRAASLPPALALAALAALAPPISPPIPLSLLPSPAEACVVSCAVNVICELANKNPKNYLSMAPQFFRLLTTSSNNWMLIKVRGSCCFAQRTHTAVASPLRHLSMPPLMRQLAFRAATFLHSPFATNAPTPPCFAPVLHLLCTCFAPALH